jgi:Sugar kinases, ribokinase family
MLSTSATAGKDKLSQPIFWDRTRLIGLVDTFFNKTYIFLETMSKIISFGEALIDLTPEGRTASGAPIFSANPGGAPANLSVMAAKLGADAAFMGAVGADAFGGQLKNALAAGGVDTSFMVEKPANTGLAIVQLDDKGERSFSFYRSPGADELYSSDDIIEEKLKNVSVFHYGTASFTSGSCRSVIAKAIEIVKKNGGLTSFDPNYRDFMWQGKDNEIKQIIRDNIAEADLLKLSDNEADMIYGGHGEAEIAKSPADFTVFTLGEEGCLYKYKNTIGRVAAIKVTPADTTGAGDAFWGATLAQYVAGFEDIEQMLRRSNIAGALTTTKKGAISAFPSKEEIESYL